MPNKFVIAIASGKGGTGKTTIATNLARCIADLDRNVQYLDCDVEEPNGHIFLKPRITASRQVTIDVPQVNLQKCTACGKCGQICQYGAIVSIKENVLTFDQLCHSCGGCWRICPEYVIKPKPLNIGDIELGKADTVDFVSGKLRIGYVRAPSLIKQVKKYIKQNQPTIIDVPPGTSCPVVEAVKNADFVLLVTEPTPFGLNDLKLAVELTREMNIPFAVVINRYDIGNDEVEKYCKAESIDIIMKLPDDRRIAEAYSTGKMIIDMLPQYRKHFDGLYKNVSNKLVGQSYEKR